MRHLGLLVRIAATLISVVVTEPPTQHETGPEDHCADEDDARRGNGEGGDPEDPVAPMPTVRRLGGTRLDRCSCWLGPRLSWFSHAASMNGTTQESAERA